MTASGVLPHACATPSRILGSLAASTLTSSGGWIATPWLCWPALGPDLGPSGPEASGRLSWHYRAQVVASILWGQTF